MPDDFAIQEAIIAFNFRLQVKVVIRKILSEFISILVFYFDLNRALLN